MALDTLTTNPAADTLSAAMPAPVAPAAPANPGVAATQNLRLSALLSGTNDVLNNMVLDMNKARTAIPGARQAVADAAAMHAGDRTKYQSYLDSLTGPENQSALNYNALGHMFSNWQKGSFLGGSDAYMDARDKNMKFLQDAQQRAQESRYMMGKEDYAIAQANLKDLEQQQKDREATYAKLVDDYMKGVKDNIVTLPADDFGTVMGYDKTSNNSFVIGSPGTGVTQKQVEAATAAALKAMENSKGTPNYTQENLNRLAAQYVEAARQSNIQQALQTLDPSDRLQVERFEKTFRTKVPANLQKPNTTQLPGSNGAVTTQSTGAASPPIIQVDDIRSIDKLPPEQQQVARDQYGQFGAATFYKGNKKLPDGYNPDVLKNRMQAEEYTLKKFDDDHQLAINAAPEALNNADMMEALLNDPKTPFGPQAPWIADFGNILAGLGVKAPITDKAGNFNIAQAQVAGRTLIKQLEQRGVATEKDTQLAMSTLANLKGTREAALFLNRIAKASASMSMLKNDFLTEFQSKNADMEVRNPRLVGHEESNKFFSKMPLMVRTNNGVVFANEFINDYMNTVQGASKPAAIAAYMRLYGRK